MVLLLFLWIGAICAFNQSEGGVPLFINLWNIVVRMGVIIASLGAISFRILAGMLSGAFVGNWFERIFSLDLLYL